MSNIERGPERIEVGVARADGTHWPWRDIIAPTRPVFEKVEYVRGDLHQGAVELLRDVATSGVSFEDPRVGYLEVQIDRVTWEALATYKGQ